MLVYELENQILAGNINMIKENLPYLIDTVDHILSIKEYSQDDINVLRAIINIFNIIYNNSSDETSLIDDGIYDMLVVRYVDATGLSVPGAPQVDFVDSTADLNKTGARQAVRFFDKKERESKIQLYDNIFNDTSSESYSRAYGCRYGHINDQAKSPVLFTQDIAKRTHSLEHGDSNLVGTLDKCKFVLVQDAINAGVDINDPKIKILERDFFAEHIKAGILDSDREFTIILSLKYDGCSIEADCTNVVEGARSRGDTGIGLASDMTPILRGYPFNNANPSLREPYGIKFEAIMTYESLHHYNMARCKDYKNCRTAINGLFNAGDAGRYRDYITLVPLDMTPNEEVRNSYKDVFPNMPRIGDIIFLNNYYTSNGVPFICSIETGLYHQQLFMIKKFLEEAEYARQYMGFMYDGIVVEYADQDLRDALGRKNYVNQFAMAVKFNPLKKQTIFRGYTYTVGKDGSITPMIHYDPVDFLGTVHPKSSGQSYAHFHELALKVGDIIDVTYTNDVMPYVTRPDNEHNQNNPNPLELFPDKCPICGSDIRVSDTQKSAYCTNTMCPGRLVSKTTDMLAKLGFEGFADKSVEDIGVHSFAELMTMKPEDLNLGVADTASFVAQRDNLLSRNIYDYEFLGCLGFTGMASEKWKTITKAYRIEELMGFIADGSLEYMLTSIKGVGPKTARIISEEYPSYRDDIIFGLENLHIIPSKGMQKQISIRYTGCSRNLQLKEQLSSMGYDAEDKGVTKDTDVLVVPYEGFTSTKTAKAGPKTKIVTMDQLLEVLELYGNLNMILTE